MGSLDIVILFTKIIVEETINIITNDAFLTSYKVHNLEKDRLKELFTFEAYESFFIFNGEYFSQIDGIAWRSGLDPTLSNAFYCHFGKNGFQNSP